MKKSKGDAEFDLASPNPQQKFSDAQLERFILFAVAVAGKTAKTIVLAIDKFLSLEKGASPFLKVRRMLSKRALRRHLKAASLGRYNVLTQSYAELVRSNINLRTCTVEELEKFHGIGAKTARFFILHTRPNQRLAALDTHVLYYLKHELKIENVPEQTPVSRTIYSYLEDIFIKHAEELGLSPVELDSRIWNMYSKYRVSLKTRKRMYTLNETYFQTWSNEMAYVLGYLAADGCIYVDKYNNSVLIFGSHEKDKTLLDNIQVFLGSNHPQTYKPKQKFFEIHIGSKNMCADLISLGITPRKSNTLMFPNISDEYVPHFVRGYFDGDGSVHVQKSNGKLHFTVRGTKAFLSTLQTHFNRLTNTTWGSISLSGNYILRFNGRKSPLAFGEWLYKDSTDKTRLLRKYNYYVNYMKGQL